MTWRKGTVPEYRVRKKTRGAGFVPSWEEGEVELWQVWCRSSDLEEGHRATFEDLRKAGFVPKPKRKAKR